MEPLRIYNGAHWVVLAVEPGRYTTPEAAAAWLKAPTADRLTVNLPSPADIDPYLEALRQHFTWVEAAGGVVGNAAGEVLLMHRRGVWDLPKGKLDVGETPETAALREITEETGLSQLALGPLLCHTYHVYYGWETWWLKRTYWYRVTAVGSEKLVPQASEDISELRWVSVGQLSDFPTYATLQDVLRAYAA